MLVGLVFPSVLARGPVEVMRRGAVGSQRIFMIPKTLYRRE